MTHIDARQCASTYFAPVVATNYPLGNNDVFNLHFDDVNSWRAVTDVDVRPLGSSTSVNVRNVNRPLLTNIIHREFPSLVYIMPMRQMNESLVTMVFALKNLYRILHTQNMTTSVLDQFSFLLKVLLLLIQDQGTSRLYSVRTPTAGCSMVPDQ